MITVREILEETADHVGGHGIDLDCSAESDNKVLRIFNESQRLLMNRGDFEGTDKDVSLNVVNGIVTLDRKLATIKHFNVCGRAGTLHNRTFKYLQQGPGDISVCSPGDVLQDLGDHFPTVNDMVQPAYIYAYSDRPEDCSPELKIYGTDISGREISRHFNSDKGFTIPIKENPGVYTSADSRTSGIVASVSALRKDRTKGYVYVFAYLPGFNPYWLVTLAPDQERSNHRRYKVPGCPNGYNLDMQAFVSMRWCKQYPGDIAIIQNIDAFVLMARAINARNDDEYGLFQTLRNAALSELKAQRAKTNPAHGSFLNVKDSRRKIRNGSTKYRYGNSSSHINGHHAIPCAANSSPTITPLCSPIQPPCATTPVDSSTCYGFEEIAAVDLPQRRAVYINNDGKLELADPTIAPAVGIIEQATVEGASVLVQQIGEMTGFSGLIPGSKYYLSTLGVLSLTPAVSGYSQSLGTAIDATSIMIDIGEPLFIP